MNELIEKYVKLVLSIGQIDPDYVDAYYGPAKWSAETSQRSNDKEFSIKKLIDEANDIIDSLDNIKYGKERSLEALRLKFFKKQMTAVKGRLFMLGGSSYSFDEESRMLYDATAPTYPEEYFKSVLNKMDLLLSGGGNLIDKLEDFRKSFTIPKDKVSDVFNAAIDECRRITQKYIPLPANESFRLEYVTDKPWSGYNWYKGNSFSLIQVNLDLPIFIERAVELAAHEGYPGHHVYNSLLEKEMVNKKEWLEFTVYPLFSPQSLIAEGTANYGVKMSMPGESRIDFEKEVLFPIAGLDPAEAGSSCRPAIHSGCRGPGFRGHAPLVCGAVRHEAAPYPQEPREHHSARPEIGRGRDLSDDHGWSEGARLSHPDRRLSHRRRTGDRPATPGARPSAAGHRHGQFRDRRYRGGSRHRSDAPHAAWRARI